MNDDRKQCGACNNLDAYWAEKARKQEAERGLLKDRIEGGQTGAQAEQGVDRPAPSDDEEPEGPR